MYQEGSFRSSSTPSATQYISYRSTHVFHLAAWANGGPATVKGSITGMDAMVAAGRMIT